MMSYYTQDVGTLKERIRELEAEVKEAREDAETDKIHSLGLYYHLYVAESRETDVSQCYNRY